MIKIISFFVITILFVGCANPELTIRKYDKYTKDHILNQAKKVFILADDDDFIIDSYRNELNVTRAKAAFYGYKMDLVFDEYYLKAYKDGNKTTAELTITRSYGMDKTNKKYLGKSAHNLFWDRLDYLLGEKTRWIGCTEHRLLFGLEGSLCDVLSNKNTKPSKDDILVNKIVEVGKQEKLVDDIVPITLDTKKVVKVEPISLDGLDNVNLSGDKNISDINNTKQNIQVGVDFNDTVNLERPNKMILDGNETIIKPVDGAANIILDRNIPTKDSGFIGEFVTDGDEKRILAEIRDDKAKLEVELDSLLKESTPKKK